jgi:uncharacterized RDD family membrane protein YckC
VSNAPSPVPGTPAEIPARLAARAIDVIVLAAISGLLGWQIGFGFDWLVVTAIAVWEFFALCDTLWGATLGKRAVGLRVIGPEGNRPTLKQALIREAFTILGAIPFIGPLLALAAWIWIFLSVRSNPLRQGKHDMLAGGTRVVRFDRAVSR